MTIVTHYIISNFLWQNENSSVENETELEKSQYSQSTKVNRKREREGREERKRVAGRSEGWNKK